MTDRVNPIAAEFGETEGMIPVAQINTQQEINASDDFQKEMERKSRTVKGKEEERQTEQDKRQMEYEAIVNKASVQEAEAVRSSQNSILDIQKPSSERTSSNETAPLEAASKVAQTSSATESSNDSSQDQDSFSQNLPNQMPTSDKEKESGKVNALGTSTPIQTNPVANNPEQKITEVTKSLETIPEQKSPLATPLAQTHPLATNSVDTNPVPTDGEKKKIEVSVDMQSSSGQKDSNSRGEGIAVQLSKETPNPEEKSSTPFATINTSSAKAEPISKQVQEKVEMLSSPKSSLQAAKAETVVPAQNTPLQVSQVEKKEEAPVTTEPGFEQSSQDQNEQNPQTSLGNAQPISEEQTDQTGDIASPFAVAHTSETRKGTWISKNEQEKAEGHVKIEDASESQSSDQQQKKRESQQDEKEKYAISQSSQNLLNQLFPDLTPTAPQEAIGFDRLPAYVLDLFDRMVGVITVMQMQGKTETTLYLNEQQSALFKNTAVTITSYSTAPMAYNIEFKAPPQASSVLQKNVNQLKNAFKDPKKEFNFQIHEIMVSLQEDESK